MAPGYIMRPHLSVRDCLGSARQNRGFPLDKNSSLKPINCEQGELLGKEMWTGRAVRTCSFGILPRWFPSCSISVIIGGELLEIRAECHCYHGHTTRKREQERQRCNEGLHGRLLVKNHAMRPRRGSLAIGVIKFGAPTARYRHEP